MEQAFDHIRKENFNYVVTDFLTPLQVGKEFVIKMEEVQTSDTKIIFMTALNQPLEPLKDLIHASITKPFSVATLANLLRPK